ncbi:BMP/retinoic acid-inducible neural-specific protein 2 isoform X2 [Onychostruthus taczanowskii]|uniref:BMP/retinoic acid-inducible neural-specific protein 2 isoform X2 n=1 Tax=Onychostruthus taczanowskii TaxID=356909 RepID=UPI001B801963|nr:BMP/retinoic acid-inducible neural-specific protein 2 isoform X2 [Onychostruthus taczanowskii]
MGRQDVPRADGPPPMLPLALLALSACCRWGVAGGAGSTAPQGHAAPATASSSSSSPSPSARAPLDWLLSDRGPFYRAQEYVDFMERYRQGFTTREFARWKVNNLALERKDFFSLPLPLAPEFIRNIRLLGRRPSPQQITDSLIKKYGTHFLLAATLGGEESLTIFVDKRKLSRRAEPAAGAGNSSGVSLETLHQLAASYFIDRESTLRRLHHIQIATAAIKVTETRTGPLGCSNYDNLDSVSSVLVQSPENKVQLQGLQTVLPSYLRERFVAAALSYIACGSAGELVCRRSDCRCQCQPAFPRCNCPDADIQALESSLAQLGRAWESHHSQFEESEEFQALVKRLPTDRFLNRTAISHFWTMDLDVQHRYQQLGTSLKLLSRKTYRLIRRLFNLSKRCHRQPRFKLPKERSLPYWWSRAQSLLYCSETTVPGTFLEESHSCTCPSEQPSCQGSIPCALGEGPACASCDQDNSTRCGTCNHGYVLTQGFCRPEVADSLEHYLGLETDLQDLELKYLLQKRDSRIEVHSIFISNDMRLGSWFDPSWRKRMLLTLKSNKYKPGLVHVMLALSLQICLTKNSTLEPVMAIYVNPFGGSHSESWFMPVNEGNFPDWERTTVDASAQCQNWTITLGNKWKTFFETVHVYLRSRIKSLDDSSNETIYYEPLEMSDPSKNLGYMKINSLQVFGYSLPFEPDAIRDLILQLDYPYTQGSQDSAMLQLLEIRDRVNRLSPPGKIRLDLFTCLLRHRLKLANNEVARIQSSLRAFNAKLPNALEQETGKLCS